MNIKQVGYRPIILTIILVGLFIACAPKESGTKAATTNTAFRQQYLGGIDGQKIYKLKVDSSEYIVIMGGYSSTGIIKHK